jgi:predicted DNA-binding antitoxin AbrB/MazE fold protein
MKTIHAIFDHGVFRPQAPVSVPQGTEVRVLIPENARDVRDSLKTRFPDSIGVLRPEDAAEIMQAVEEAFGRVDPDAWR